MRAVYIDNRPTDKRAQIKNLKCVRDGIICIIISMALPKAKHRITLKADSDFDLLLQSLEADIKHDNVHYMRCLHDYTNRNGIALDTLSIRRSGYQNANNTHITIYHVRLSKLRRNGDFNESDSQRLDDDDDDEFEIEYVINAYEADYTLRGAIESAMAAADRWDRCQECDVYSSKIVNHKCPSCIMMSHKLQTAAVEEKFECLVCHRERFNRQCAKLPCCKQDGICDRCIKKVQNRSCPLCRAPLDSQSG